MQISEFFEPFSNSLKFLLFCQLIKFIFQHCKTEFDERSLWMQIKDFHTSPLPCHLYAELISGQSGYSHMQITWWKCRHHLFSGFDSSLNLGWLQNIKEIFPRNDYLERGKKSIEILWMTKIFLIITVVCSLKESYVLIDLTLYQSNISDLLLKSGFSLNQTLL